MTPEERDAAETRLGIDLRDRAGRLIAAVEAFARQMRRQTVILLAGLAVFVIVVVGIWVDLQGSKSARATLLDCVQPSGHCYQAGQKRSAKVLGEVSKIIALAAACAPDYVNLPLPKRIVAIEDCVNRGMK